MLFFYIEENFIRKDFKNFLLLMYLKNICGI